MPLFAIPFPAINPVAISLGPFAIRWYALAYIVGLLIGWRYCLALAARPPGLVDRQDVDDFPKLTSWFASVRPGRRSKYSRSSRAGSISISFGAGLPASGEMVMSAPSCYGTGHDFAFQISAAY